MPGNDRDSDDTGGVVMAIQRASIAEVKRDVIDVRADVVRLEVRVDEHGRHLGDLRERAAMTEGQVMHLVDAYQRTAATVATQAAADAEVRRAGAVAEIRERERQAKHRRAIQRELIFKAVTVAMGLWAIASSILAARC